MDPDILRLVRREAHRQRLLALLLTHRGPVSEFEALARDLDAFAERLEGEAGAAFRSSQI
jgi:hypothetical protein